MAKGKTDWSLAIQAGVGLLTVGAIVGGFKYFTQPKPPPPPLTFDKTKIRNSWKPNTLAKRIANNLQGWNLLTVDAGITPLIKALNKDESIWLSNYYNFTFFKKDEQTLYELLSTEMNDFDLGRMAFTKYNEGANHLAQFGIR